MVVHERQRSFTGKIARADRLQAEKWESVEHIYEIYAHESDYAMERSPNFSLYPVKEKSCY